MIEDFLHQGFNAEHAENIVLHSIDAILIENCTNYLIIGFLNLLKYRSLTIMKPSITQALQHLLMNRDWLLMLCLNL